MLIENVETNAGSILGGRNSKIVLARKMLQITKRYWNKISVETHKTIEKML